MTAPQPPDPNTLAAIVEVGHRERDAAELRLKLAVQRHRVLLVCVLASVAVAAWYGYGWHVKHLAQLEAQASVEKTKAHNEHALGEKWKARAIALTDSVRVDTVRVDSIIYRTRAFTAPVTLAAPDGTTSVVPMTVVRKADFDSLGAACTRAEHDCSSALAAKDSVIAHQDSARVALEALNANTAKQLGMTKRAALLSKILWAVAGIVVGRASAIH